MLYLEASNKFDVQKAPALQVQAQKSRFAWAEFYDGHLRLHAQKKSRKDRSMIWDCISEKASMFLKHNSCFRVYFSFNETCFPKCKSYTLRLVWSILPISSSCWLVTCIPFNHWGRRSGLNAATIFPRSRWTWPILMKQKQKIIF